MENCYNGLSEELVAALKRLDVLAGPEQLEYFYNLYDPETGGFYYSISSRDCERMTPFAEGTRFSLEALLTGGMELPDWYKEKAGNWILNHQEESDGFFYEDLWGKITSGPRINRDLGYSIDILSERNLAKISFFKKSINLITLSPNGSYNFRRRRHVLELAPQIKNMHGHRVA